MKKLFAMLISAAMIVSAAAGCDKKAEDTSSAAGSAAETVSEAVEIQETSATSDEPEAPSIGFCASSPVHLLRQEPSKKISIISRTAAMEMRSQRTARRLAMGCLPFYLSEKDTVSRK